MEKDRRRKKRFLPILIVLIVLVWTCIIMLDGKNFFKHCQSMFMDFLVDAGMSNVNVVNVVNADNEASFQWKIIFEACPFMTYLVENEDRISVKNISGAKSLASAYPGYRSKSRVWSGAGADMVNANILFENSDIQIAELEEEEDEYAKMLEENEKAKGIDEQSDDDIVIEAADAGDTYISDGDISEDEEADEVFSPQIKSNLTTINKLKKSQSRSYLLSNFYITDSSTSIDNSIFNVSKLLSKDVTLEKSNEPQILIFHTHGASESFIDSRSGKKADTIVGVGGRLAYILRKKYGYNVIHDTTQYDKIGGKIDRNKAYNNAAKGISETLEKYPSIQVVIDLHRDGVGNNVQRLTEIDGKKTSQVMFFNGLSRNSSGNIDYLYNPNLQANLAFSLQMKLKCMEKYPDFAKPIYLKNYRYNMHLRERFLLIELGNENNTVEEAKNAMPPLAEVLDEVLKGE